MRNVIHRPNADPAVEAAYIRWRLEDLRWQRWEAVEAFLAHVNTDHERARLVPEFTIDRSARTALSFTLAAEVSTTGRTYLRSMPSGWFDAPSPGRRLAQGTVEVLDAEGVLTVAFERIGEFRCLAHDVIDPQTGTTFALIEEIDS